VVVAVVERTGTGEEVEVLRAVRILLRRAGGLDELDRPAARVAADLGLEGVEDVGHGGSHLPGVLDPWGFDRTGAASRLLDRTVRTRGGCCPWRPVLWERSCDRVSRAQRGGMPDAEEFRGAIS